ncbi:hypothetical protein ACJJVG_08860 [Pseudocitrobacter faecalis]|uniref:hypothetical protein n=1 Tax=Pseudocitrobacter faecalis TaxID=1398493 RepID=UPI00389B1A41
MIVEYLANNGQTREIEVEEVIVNNINLLKVDCISVSVLPHIEPSIEPDAHAVICSVRPLAVKPTVKGLSHLETLHALSALAKTGKELNRDFIFSGEEKVSLEALLPHFGV